MISKRGSLLIQYPIDRYLKDMDLLIKHVNEGRIIVFCPATKCKVINIERVDTPRGPALTVIINECGMISGRFPVKINEFEDVLASKTFVVRYNQ